MEIKLLGSLFILNRWLLKYFPYAGSSPLYTIVQIIWKRVLLWPYFYLLRLEMEELTTSKSSGWELSRWVKAVSLWGCFHTCRSANLVRINGTKILVLVQFLFTLSVFLFVLMRQEERPQSYPDWQGTLWLDSFGIIRTDEGKIWLTDMFLQHLNVSDVCIYILRRHNELMRRNYWLLKVLYCRSATCEVIKDASCSLIISKYINTVVLTACPEKTGHQRLDLLAVLTVVIYA